MDCLDPESDVSTFNQTEMQTFGNLYITVYHASKFFQGFFQFSPLKPQAIRRHFVIQYSTTLGCYKLKSNVISSQDYVMPHCYTSCETSANFRLPCLERAHVFRRRTYTALMSNS